MGNSVDMGFFEMLIYILIPFATIFMRIFRLNGSLDKLWLFLFFAPPFSIIHVLAAKWGWIAPGKGGSPIDIYMWIPIVTRVILLFILTNFPGSSLLFKLLITTSSLLFANMLSLVNKRKCTSENSSTFGLLQKSLYDAFLQYGCALLSPIIIKYLPIIGPVIKLLAKLPLIGGFIELLLWICGYAFMYILINLYDGNFTYNDAEFCAGGIGWFKHILSIISIIVSIMIELGKLVF